MVDNRAFVSTPPKCKATLHSLKSYGIFTHATFGSIFGGWHCHHGPLPTILNKESHLRISLRKRVTASHGLHLWDQECQQQQYLSCLFHLNSVALFYWEITVKPRV